MKKIMILMLSVLFVFMSWDYLKKKHEAHEALMLQAIAEESLAYKIIAGEARVVAEKKFAGNPEFEKLIANRNAVKKTFIEAASEDNQKILLRADLNLADKAIENFLKGKDLAYADTISREGIKESQANSEKASYSYTRFNSNEVRAVAEKKLAGNPKFEKLIADRDFAIKKFMKSDEKGIIKGDLARVVNVADRGIRNFLRENDSAYAEAVMLFGDDTEFNVCGNWLLSK